MKNSADPKLLYTVEYDNLGNVWKKDTYVYDKSRANYRGEKYR